MRIILLLAVFLAEFNFAAAQWNWTNVDSSFGDLPPSIHVYYTETPTEAKPNKAYYVSIDMNDRSVNFSARVGNGKRLTPQQYFQTEHQPLLVMNCTFFEFVHNSNLNKCHRYQCPAQSRCGMAICRFFFAFSPSYSVAHKKLERWSTQSTCFVISSTR